MPVVIALVLLQLVAAQTVWTLSNTTMGSEDLFALFLGVNLVAFSMVSYAYRVDKRGDIINKYLLYIGLGFIVVLLVTSIFV